jgi:lysophospholipase L1-like esterase
VAHLVSTGAVRYATLIVGANDALNYLPAIIQGTPAPFVSTVTANIETALNRVAAAGEVRLAVGNIPDIGVTPSLQFELANDPQLHLTPQQIPFVLQEITDATNQANREVERFAAERGIPVIDMFKLGGLGKSPVTVGGVQVTNLYAPDFFHPNTVGQGLLADAVLEALGDAYNPRIERFSLTDQQILDNAHIPHARGSSHFDVSPFVIVNAEHEGQGHERGDSSGFPRPAESLALSARPLADSSAGGHWGTQTDLPAHHPIESTPVLGRIFAEGADPWGETPF